MVYRRPMVEGDLRHGTVAGYQAGCRDTCCVEAKRKYGRYWTYARTKRMRFTVDGKIVRRKLEALMSLGYGMTEIGLMLEPPVNQQIMSRMLNGHIGRIRVARANHIDKVYRELQLKPKPDTGLAKKARAEARKRGYAPPLAWDDIDDLNDYPKGIPGMCTTARCPNKSHSTYGPCKKHHRLQVAA